MAKKKEVNFVSACAFWGLVIAAAIFIVHGIFSAFGLFSNVVAIIDLVGKVALFIAVAVSGYGFIVGRRTAWKVVYWVALAIYVAGIVFGILHF